MLPARAQQLNAVNKVHLPSSSMKYKVPTTPFTKFTLPSAVGTLEPKIVAHATEPSVKFSQTERCRRSVRPEADMVPVVALSGVMVNDSWAPILLQRTAGPRVRRVGRE